MIPRAASSWGTVGLAVVAALGCGLGEMGRTETERANAAACAGYVEHINGLGACANLAYDADNLCQGAAFASVDMTAYYACLIDRSRCEGDELALDVDACEPPLVALVVAPDPASPDGGDGAALRSIEGDEGMDVDAAKNDRPHSKHPLTAPAPSSEAGER